MRVAVIGLGSIGRRHIGNLLALGCEVSVDDCDVLAVVQAFDDFAVSSYFRQGADAYVIATPHDSHLRWVREAIDQGIPFFVEKPLGSLEQLSQWRELASKDLPVNQVGYQLRFHPKAQALKALRPTSGNLAVECDSRTWPGSAYGPMLLEMSHEIDLAHFLGADMVVTAASMEGQTIRVELGGRWWVTLTDHAPKYFRSWWAHSDTKGQNAIFTSPASLGAEMYFDEMRHFLDCVREHKPTACTLQDGLATLEVCAAVEDVCRSWP